MVTYAYLRVSTNQQDVDNQRHGILEYANQKNLGHLEFVSDSVSGQKRWRERELGKLLTNTTKAGDIILLAEISRMARSTLQVLEILECCMQRELIVHIAKQQMVLDDKLPSRITATVLGLAAEIERELISMRTKEALAKRKASGKPLGRPKGSMVIFKLPQGYSKKLLSIAISSNGDMTERNYPANHQQCALKQNTAINVGTSI